MAADHSARGSMKTGVKPETVCELQDTNDHRQVERKWRLPISVGKLSGLEGRLINLPSHDGSRGRFVMSKSRTRTGHTLNTSVARARHHMASSQVPVSGGVTRGSVLLASMPMSLIRISEPRRQEAIPAAGFCLRKKEII